MRAGLVLLILLSGCLNLGAGSDDVPGDEMAPMLPPAALAVDDDPSSTARVSLRIAPVAVYGDPDWITVSILPSDWGNVRASCERSDHTGEEFIGHFVSVAVWNRTGAVYGDKIQMPTGDSPPRPFNLTGLHDPPFAVLAGGGLCNGIYTVEAPGGQAIRLPDNKGEYDAAGVLSDGTSPNGPTAPPTTEHEIVIPAGQTTGSTTLMVGADPATITNAPTLGSPKPPTGSFGNMYVYGPGAEVGGPDWIHRIEEMPQQEAWYQRYVVTREPGEYVFYVELAAPAVNDTIWPTTGGTQEVWTDKMEEWGFQLPFRVYV